MVSFLSNTTFVVTVTKERVLKLTLPKGSLETTVRRLFADAGYQVSDASRDYRPSINDEEIFVKMLRPQEIPNYLIDPDGFDLGISGQDWVLECGADVETVLNLEVGTVRIVFCVPEAWEHVNSFDQFVEEFAGNGKPIRISTEYLTLSTRFVTRSAAYKKYFGDRKPTIITPWQTWGDNDRFRVYLSFGATEAKPPEEVDAIIDNTETGSTIRANGLKIVETLSTSSAVLIANKHSLRDPWKREKIEDVKTLLSGVIEARHKVHLFVNVKEANLEPLLEKLPALKRPTISPLASDGPDKWYGINTIIDKAEFLRMIPTLRRLCQGIVVLDPRQVLPFD
ncbi:MAG: ATP phosphoribosyltransferase [Promethearchaeota archaeon]